jgi:plastocyanin domain-containing protein
MTKYLLHALFIVSVFAVSMLCGTAETFSQTARKKPRVQTATVMIGQYGYEPASIRLKRGVPARITFRRIVESTCATEVVFADYGINRALPLNTNVTVSLTPKKAGEFAFACGMNMHRGKLLVQ